AFVARRSPRVFRGALICAAPGQIRRRASAVNEILRVDPASVRRSVDPAESPREIPAAQTRQLPACASSSDRADRVLVEGFLWERALEPELAGLQGGGGFLPSSAAPRSYVLRA